jgi:hypothetical protein
MPGPVVVELLVLELVVPGPVVLEPPVPEPPVPGALLVELQETTAADAERQAERMTT